MKVRRLRAAELIDADVRALRSLFDAAWPDGGFDDMDWEHATGGTHVVLEEAGRILSHASVVPRRLVAGTASVQAGYVEAVATHPDHAGRGHGSAVMRKVNDIILAEHELGALSTGLHAFYERLGWLRWRGPTWVRTADGLLRTADDDDGVMVLATPSMPAPDLDGPLSCEWRAGDVW